MSRDACAVGWNVSISFGIELIKDSVRGRFVLSKANRVSMVRDRECLEVRLATQGAKEVGAMP